MLQVAVADLGDMHQPVLMDADVHEHAEVNDISHRAGELHSGLQILQLQHIGAQDRGGQFIAGIASGF